MAENQFHRYMALARFSPNKAPGFKGSGEKSHRGVKNQQIVKSIFLRN